MSRWLSRRVRNSRTSAARRWTLAPLPSPRDQGFFRAALGFEPLEDRRVLTSILYLDFGDNFPAGGLDMTVGQLRGAIAGNVGIQGPDFREFDNNNMVVDYADNLGLRFTAMAPLVTFDYNASGAVNNTDYTDLRAAVVSLTQRYYSNLDANVVIAPALNNANSANYLQGIRDTLNLGMAVNGERDAWVFVTRVIRTDNNMSVGADKSLNGQAAGADIGGNNARDDSAVTFADVILGGNPNATADTRLAYTAAHEAGHTFGQRHRNNGTSGTALDADMAQLTRSELVTESAGATNRTNFVFNTRYPLIRGDGNNNPPPATNSFNANDVENQYTQLANNNRLGVRAGAPDYVTGTGANDLISITFLNPGQATVSVQAFRDAGFTSAITVPGTAMTTFSYTINTANGILIESGFGNDRITIDASLGVNISLFGMAGTDQLVVMGNSAPSGSYTPAGTSVTKLDGNAAFAGTVVVGATNISFDEFETAGSVSVQDVGSFTFRTPNAADNVAINSPQAGRNRISGASGGQMFVPLTFFNVTTFIVDLATNDGGAGADTMFVNSALVASGLQNLTVNAGTGDDTLGLFNANLSLPVGGGAFTYNGGGNATPAGDTILTQADVNWTLTNSSLASSGGGQVALNGVESADLAGGASANLFTVSGWTGLGSITGHENNDTIIATKNANFTLGDASLSASDGMNLDLNSIEVANLTGGPGANQFDTSGWTGTGTINGMGGSDTIVDPKDGDFTLTDSSLMTTDGMNLSLVSIEIANLTGGPSANRFEVGGWTGSGNINGAGGDDTIAATKNADFTLSAGLLSASDGMTLGLVSLEIAELTGGPASNLFSVQSWNGVSVHLAGQGNSDTYSIANPDLDAVAAAVMIFDSGGLADSIIMHDAGHAKLVDYTIAGNSVTSQFTNGAPRAFHGLMYNDAAIELLTLNGSMGANNFYVTPDDTTEFNIHGDLPTFAGPGIDYLEVDFTGTKGRKLTYSGPPLGNGMWEFLGSGMPLIGVRENINFTSIEKLNYFEVLAVGADAGWQSQPRVKVLDAETGDLSVEFLAYAPNFRGGVRVAVGDVNGDGIPEVVTAPAGVHAPTVKVFDILTGNEFFAFQGSIPGFSPGLQVAVGDVNGDSLGDVVTGWASGLPYVHIFENTGNYFAPFNNYQAKAGGGLPATPALNAFVGVFTFSFGIGGLAIGNVQGHAGGTGDIVVASAASLAPVVRVFDYFTNGTSYIPVRQFMPFGGFGVGPIALAVGNVDSASGNADIVMGASVRGRGQVAVWHNDANSISTFTPYTGHGSGAAVRVAVKRSGAMGEAQIFTAQGPGGLSHEIRRFDPSGALIDFILEDDLEFANGIWLG